MLNIKLKLKLVLNATREFRQNSIIMYSVNQKLDMDIDFEIKIIFNIVIKLLVLLKIN